MRKDTPVKYGRKLHGHWNGMRKANKIKPVKKYNHRKLLIKMRNRRLQATLKKMKDDKIIAHHKKHVMKVHLHLNKASKKAQKAGKKAARHIKKTGSKALKKLHRIVKNGFKLIGGLKLWISKNKAQQAAKILHMHTIRIKMAIGYATRTINAAQRKSGKHIKKALKKSTKKVIKHVKKAVKLVKTKLKEKATHRHVVRTHGKIHAAKRHVHFHVRKSHRLLHGRVGKALYFVNFEMMLAYVKLLKLI